MHGRPFEQVRLISSEMKPCMTDDDDVAVFHDCGTWSIDQGETGDCDGSLILAQEAFTRNENRKLENISTKLQAVASKFSVGVADLIVFAASVVIITCPLGPIVRSTISLSKSPAKISSLSFSRLSPLSVVQTPRTWLLQTTSRTCTPVATQYSSCLKIKPSPRRS